MKRKEWKTKRERREARAKDDRGIVDFIKVVRHFFKELPDWIGEMEDGRDQRYITYTQQDLVFMGILKNACSVGSMHQMDDLFNEDACIRALQVLAGDAGLEEMPHCDTLNYYLSKLSPSCLQGLRDKMVASLIRSKPFNSARLLGKYWRVVVDGTGLFCFKERHCPHCLKQTYRLEDGTEVARYFHKVLEARLVLGDGLAISLGTEFIENEAEDVDKQDCELKAAGRLFERIKGAFPRLSICIQADALYEAEGLMALCRKLGWRYLITHKDTRQPTVGGDFALLDEGDRTAVPCVGRERGTATFYNGVHELSGKAETMNIIEYTFERGTENGEKETARFKWCTDICVTRYNVGALVDAGRGRWVIENEGFNVQKNVLYDIEHLNSRDPVAMKCHYLLTQIADIIFQLYTRWNAMARKYGQGLKITSSRLLESFRQHLITEEDVSYIMRRTSMYLE